MAAIRNDGVGVTCLVEEDGLGGLAKEIDDGSAAEAEGACVDAEFEDLLAVGAFEARKEEDDLGFAAEARLGERLEAA